LSRAAATADPRPLSLPDALPISGIDPDHTHRLFLSLPALAREPSTKPEHPPAVAHAGARAPSSLRHRPGRAGRNPSRGRRPPPPPPGAGEGPRGPRPRPARHEAPFPAQGVSAARRGYWQQRGQRAPPDAAAHGGNRPP